MSETRCKLSVISPRISQMILDKVLNGVLDQGRGCLLLFDATESDVSPNNVYH